MTGRKEEVAKQKQLTSITLPWGEWLTILTLLALGNLIQHPAFVVTDIARGENAWPVPGLVHGIVALLQL